jgi:hypothetical protein
VLDGGKEWARRQIDIFRNEFARGDVGKAGAPPMPTSKEYRQQAMDCLELANRPNELYVKTALLELVAEFNNAAEELERNERCTETRPRFASGASHIHR